MITFSMNKIELHQFAIVTQNIEKKDIKGIKALLNFQILSKMYSIGVSVRFEFLGQDSSLAAVAELGCLFSIKQEDWKREIQENMVIPKWILSLFAVHTVGTARGIVYAKTEDTSLRGLIIPPINVDQMIDGDLQMKGENKEDKLG